MEPYLWMEIYKVYNGEETIWSNGNIRSRSMNCQSLHRI